MAPLAWVSVAGTPAVVPVVLVSPALGWSPQQAFDYLENYDNLPTND
jgi:hypothetical protein